MATANSNTATHSKDATFLNAFEQLSCSDVRFSEMASAMAALNTDLLSEEEALEVAYNCEVSVAGLCHALSFIGKSFVTFADKNVVELSQESLCQVGHGIETISSLIPVLLHFGQKADDVLANVDE